MPGFLSNIFDSDDALNGQWDGGNPDSSSSHTNDAEAGAEAHLDPTVHIHNEMSATWENPDGSESGFSRTDDVVINADVDAVLSATTHIEQSDYEG